MEKNINMEIENAKPIMVDEQKPHFYTDNGWIGNKYNETKNLTTTEIAKLIRKEIKKTFKGMKISIRTEYFAGGSAINIMIKECGFYPINPDYDSNEIITETNQYFTKEAKQLLNEIEKIVNQYKYSDSDGMVDYFHENFYFDVTYDWKLKKGE